MASSRFTGPLFVTGMPRSGTTLIRDLLNRNERIALPEAEPQFIPRLFKKHGKRFSFDERTRQRILADIADMPFVVSRKKKTGKRFPEESFDQSNWHDLARAVLLEYGPKDTAGTKELIWGEKAPDYIGHVPLLHHIFPSAKFLHIIRDPRDYALSVKNRTQKSPIRAAHLWYHYVTAFRSYGRDKLPKDQYLEVFYEDLVRDPTGTMKRVCSFLECEFSPVMVELEEPAEKFGRAKGTTRILEDNTGRARTEFPQRTIRRMEELVYDPLKEMGYPFCSNASEAASLTLFQKVLKYIHDGVRNVLFHLRDQGGFFSGLARWWRLRKTSNWRG